MADQKTQDDSLTMTYLKDVAALTAVQEESTVSRTVLKADGARLVLFAFDEGQVLTEHTAAMPVLLQALEGSFLITGGPDEATLKPGDVIHLDTRLPHSVTALEPAKLLLIMLDNRAAPKHNRAGINA